MGDFGNIKIKGHSQVNEQFDEIVDLFMDRIAIMEGERSFTYRELDKKSNQVAHFLISKNIYRQDYVAICLEKSLDFVISFLGILKIGAICIPIDPNQPSKILNKTVEQLQPKFIFTSKKHRKTFSNSYNCGAVSSIRVKNVDQLPKPTTKEESEEERLFCIIYTSGSSGIPKGVKISHKNFLSSMEARVSYYGAAPKVLWLTAVGFDATLATIFWPLLSGGLLVIPDMKSLYDPKYLSENLREVDTLITVPTYYQYLIDIEQVIDSSLKRVILGGEEPSVNLIKRHFEEAPNLPIFNEYGPTECTVWSTVKRIEEGGRNSNIGKPLSHVKLALLDKDLNPVPEGQPGEMFISGDGVSMGYFLNPELTEKNFFTLDGVHRWYKTGDLAVRLPNEDLEFLGRVDEQVKIAGNRIELAGIKNKLLDTGQLEDAFVFARQERDTQKEIVACVVPSKGYFAQEFRESLAEGLNPAEIPSSIIELDCLPLTINGKVDRDKLIEILHDIASQGQNQEEDTDFEKLMIRLFNEATGMELDAFEGDIYQMGINSIDLIRFLGKVNRRFKLDCYLADIFKAKRLEDFLGLVIERKNSPTSLPNLKLPENLATFEQESLWLNHKVWNDDAYHLNFNFLFDRSLPTERLKQSIRLVLKKNKNLRSKFWEEEGLVLTGLLSEELWHLEEIDKSGNAFDSAGLSKILEPLMLEKFDLESDYPIKGYLIHFRDYIDVLAFIVHHIAFDQASLPVFIESLEGAFQVADYNVAPLSIPVNGHSFHGRLQRLKFERDKGGKIHYWKKRLLGSKTTRIEEQLHEEKTSQKCGIGKAGFPEGSVALLKSLAKKENTTEFVLLLAVFKLLFYKYTFHKDQIIGITNSTRESFESDASIGYFINTIPVRTKIDGAEYFREFIQLSHGELHEDLLYQLPISELVRCIDREIFPGVHPFFDVLFNVQAEEYPININLDGEIGQLINAEVVAAPYSLTFTVHQAEGNAHLEATYDSRKFTPGFIDQFLKDYLNLISQLPALLDVPIKEISMGKPQIGLQKPSGFNFLKCFERVVVESPDAIAVIGEENQLTYKELNSMANKLSWKLLTIRKGITAPIGVSTHRNVDLLVSILAIWKSGLTYVPINPDLPQNRVDSMINSAHISLVIISEWNKDFGDKFSSVDILPLSKTNWKQISSENPCIYSDNDKISHIIYTSGSTGEPKGVMISYRNLNAFLHWAYEEFENENFDVLPATSSASFDLSIFELFYPLSVGKTVFILKDGGELLHAKFGNSRVFINTVPSVLDFLIKEGMDFSQVRLVNVAGEPFPPHFLKTIDLSKISIRNLYGPTEATTYSTCKKFSAKEHITVGKPIAGTYLYVLSEDLEHCPEGVTGEICIGGLGLSSGYVGDEMATTERFIPDPYLGEGKVVYKTGDLGRFLPNGELEYKGRKDNQVKLRGHRIELEEIETRILKSGLVRASCVVLTPSEGPSILTGHLVSEIEGIKEKLNGYLHLYLPPYMIPTVWIIHDQLPLTSNGKIDRGELKNFKTSQVAKPSQTKGMWPSNSTYERVKVIWEELLGQENISWEKDFFELGGHSLLALRLIACINREFSLSLSLPDLFQHSTAKKFAELVHSQKESSPLVELSAIANRSSLLPLSYNQESLWIIDRLNGSNDYHIPLILRLKGKVEPAYLEHAIKIVVKRHEILRTIYEEINGSPFQRIISPENWKLEIENLNSYDAINEEALQRDLEEYFFTPFNLKRDFMLRSKLWVLPNGEYLWASVFHHIAADGWSLPIYLRECGENYRQIASGDSRLIHARPLSFQYAEYAYWQKGIMEDSKIKEKLDFWTELLENHKNLQLPEMPYSKEGQNRMGGMYPITFDAALTTGVKAKAKANRTSSFMLLLSVFNLTLSKFAQQEDFCVGVASSGRQLSGSEDLIGYFVNPFPLRCKVKPEESFDQYYSTLKWHFYDCLDRQEVPFELIVSEISPKRSLGSNPIFQVMFTSEYPLEVDEVIFPEVKLSHVDMSNSLPKFDLSCIVSEEDQRVRVSFEYAQKFFDKNRIEIFAQSFLKLAEQIIEFGDLPIKELSIIEELTFSSIKGETVPLLNSNKVSIISIIEFNAIKFAGKNCIYTNKGSFAFKYINERANQFAHFLRSKGIVSGTIVGVSLPRDEQYVIAILGVLKAGAAYLPIDDTLPTKRIAYMVNNGCQFFVTSKISIPFIEVRVKIFFWEELSDRISDFPADNLSIPVSLDNPAYVIYTSGSTGKPKGVVLTHGNLINFVHSFAKTPGISPEDSILSVSSISFDIGILETLLPLVFGASIYMLDNDERKEPAVILEKLDQKYISIMFATPTHWKMLFSYGWEKPFPKLKAISGGEALSLRLAKQLLEKSGEVWNIYGPTETTIFSTLKKIDQNNSIITVGRPIDNTEILILDSNGKGVSKGSEGEIAISGKGVCLKYLHNEEFNQLKFIPHPISPQKRIYLTGDLGYISNDDELLITGRSDDQVKIDGHRVELGEIMEGLREIEEIEEALVIQQKRGKVQVLIALVKLSSSNGLNFSPRPMAPDLQKKVIYNLKETLPYYMVPNFFMEISDFPITVSGKIDRQKLEKLTYIEKQPSGDPQPDSEKEKTLLKIWKEVLGMNSLKKEDNFFEVGGNSLYGAKLISKLEQYYGQKIPLSMLFKHPSVIEFANFLDTNARDSESLWKPLVPIKDSGSEASLYIVHGGGLNIHPFIELARRLPNEQPVYGFQALGLDGGGIPEMQVEEIAKEYINDLLEQNPDGPYVLAGYSLGGIIAYEMSHQLEAMGKSVSKLIFFDTYAINAEQNLGRWGKTLFDFFHSIRKRFYDFHLMIHHPKILWRIKSESIKNKIKKLEKKLGKDPGPDYPLLVKFKEIEKRYKSACKKYRLKPYHGEVHLIKAKVQSGYLPDKKYYGWKPFINNLKTWDVPGEHIDMLSEENLYEFGQALEAILKRKRNN